MANATGHRRPGDGLTSHSTRTPPSISSSLRGVTRATLMAAAIREGPTCAAPRCPLFTRSGALSGEPLRNAPGDVVSDAPKEVKAVRVGSCLPRWIRAGPVQLLGAPGKQWAALGSRIVECDDIVPALRQEPEHEFRRVAADVDAALVHDPDRQRVSLPPLRAGTLDLEASVGKRAK